MVFPTLVGVVRGSSLFVSASSSVFPTLVGVVPSLDTRTGTRRPRLPHASGGGPGFPSPLTAEPR